jgi:hypothetical protein
MNLTDIAKIRLISQQIAGTQLKTAKDMVAWMGAMQAQDYAMSKWAVGVRLPNSTDRDIETALDKGDVLRTHLLRPTWHLVSADDIYWMLSLTAPQIKTASQSRHNQLEITPAIFSKSTSIFEKALTGGKQLTREELVAELEKAKIATDENRASHLLFWAELEGIICSGATKKGKQTYALLEERVPKKADLTREEALAKLAEKYFTSHGPATIQDFVWWSGLTIRDARHALELVKSSFISETIDSQTYWFTNSFSMSEKEMVNILPAYDEFIISYTDRRASLPFENHSKAVSNNGIFRPVITINGQVIGIWKRTTKKDIVLVETEFFEQPGESTKVLIENAFLQYGIFVEKKMEIIINSSWFDNPVRFLIAGQGK